MKRRKFLPDDPIPFIHFLLNPASVVVCGAESTFSSWPGKCSVCGASISFHPSVSEIRDKRCLRCDPNRLIYENSHIPEKTLELPKPNELHTTESNRTP